MLSLRQTSRLFHIPGASSKVQQLLHKGSHWHLSSNMANQGTPEKPVEKAIIAKLTETLRPAYLEVINESHMHNVPTGSESHFKVVVVSEEFEKKNLISRHRMIHETLKQELCSSVHALSIQAKTPSQWASNSNITKSPPCLGGMAREAAEKNDTT